MNETYKFSKNQTLYVMMLPQSNAGTVTRAVWSYKMNETWALTSVNSTNTTTSSGPTSMTLGIEIIVGTLLGFIFLLSMGTAIYFIYKYIQRRKRRTAKIQAKLNKSRQDEAETDRGG